MLVFVASGHRTTHAGSSASTHEHEFAAVYRAHHAFVHRNVRRLGIPSEAVPDVTQDVFMVVARKLPEYDEQGSLRGWLFAITARVVRTRRRSARRRDRKLAAIRQSPSSTTKDERLRLECSDLLRRLMRGLEPEQRTVFILSELEGMSATEIGTQLGISPNTVYSRQRAARARLERAVARHRARAERGAAALLVVDLEQLVDAELSIPAVATPPLASAAATSASIVAWTIAGAGVVALGVGLALRSKEPAPAEPAHATVAAASPQRPASAGPPPAHDAESTDTPITDPPGEPPTSARAASPATTTPKAPSTPRGVTKASRPTRDEPAAPPAAVPAQQDPLVREANLLGQAWDALRRGELSQARALTSTHAREFPRGTMAPEREAVVTIVACRSGAPDAAARSSRYLERHGSSPHAQSVRTACEQSER